MIYQVGKKQCSNSGRKWNDIAPLESDFMVHPPSFGNFLGLCPPHPPRISNSLRGGGLDIIFLELHIVVNFYLRPFLFFFCFIFISIYYHTQKQKKNKNDLK